MAMTSSKMNDLGFIAPDFNLLDTVSGEMKTLTELKSDTATVVMFICNHCPYVVHVHQGITSISNDYLSKGVSFIAISSNDVANYPDDSPEKMTVLANKLGFKFSYLYDETQDVAKAYDAACTPDFYVFDIELKCTYRGQLDDSRPGNSLPVTGKDVRVALDAMLSGNQVNEKQKASIGCNIKWK